MTRQDFTPYLSDTLPLQDSGTFFEIVKSKQGCNVM